MLESKKFLNVVEAVKGMYAPKPETVAEATMMKDTGEVVHNCAKHVEHATWGKGVTMAEEHAAPDASGNIGWYDVLFDHGLEKAVPTDSLNILVSESHGHPVKAKKAVKEELKGNQHKIDKNKNGKIDKEDFKLLRKEEAEEIVEEADLDLEFTVEELDAIAEAYMGFEKTTKSLAAKGAKNPKALAAWIGRKKYGKEKFQAAAAAGKKLG